MAMRKMRATCFATVRKVLSILLSLLLVIQGAPVVGAYAAEHGKAIEVLESRNAGQNNKDTEDTDSQEKENRKGKHLADGDDAKTDDEEPACKSGSVTQKLKSSNGHTYVVTVDYDEEACIPANAELELELVEAGESDFEDLRTRATLELDLQEEDRLMGDAYLSVRMVADGLAVKPQSELRVTVETNAIKPSESSSVEVVLLASDDVPAAPGTKDDAEQSDEQTVPQVGEESGPTKDDALSSEEDVFVSEDDTPNSEEDVLDSEDEPLAADDKIEDEDEIEGEDHGEGQGQPKDEHIVPTNLSQQKSKRTKLSFQAGHLGTIALVSVVRRFATWKEPGLNVWLLGPRQELTLKVDDVVAPNLEDGLDALDCFRVGAEPSLDCGTTLWLEAQPTESDDAAAQADATSQDDAETIEIVDEEAGEDEEDLSATNDVRGGTFAYAVRDGELLRELCGPQGTTEPVAFRADKDSVLLAWDSGYRKATLTMRGVTVKGMLPEGTTGTARDVSKRLDDPTAFVGELDAQDEIDAGTMELQTVAAYDITLTTDGSEYEPDDEHPLKVTIANEDIQKDKDLQLWHILDDGTTEAVKDFKVLDGAIVFTATGFSTYAVTELRATTTDTTSLSTNFILKAVAKTYTRSSVVTFVDTDNNPIMGTVVGTHTITYTQEGDPANDTNSVDMYDYSSCLDPAIADEYDFSRVYLGLAQSQQKDFRYVFVTDDKMIGENRTPPYYRAYFYMTSIDQNRSGQEYYGTWYLLSNGGAMDKVFIEFYHVALASFRAVDTRGDAVEGAEFTLYSDSNCYTPFEYKHEVVRATSNKRGVVSFGKIPRGTYYMKETVVPDGYKKSTKVRTIVVDGETAIDDVVHSDDDGSVIISDARDITFKKEWAEDEDEYEDYSVIVSVVTNDEVVAELTLNKDNDWTQTLEGLDPNKSYEITESSVLNGQGTDVLHDWIPTIESEVNNAWVEYQKAEEFIRDKDYVLVANGKALTAVSNSISLIPTPVTVDGSMLSSAVTSNMLWEVTALTKDGVMTLQNVGTKKYLDENASSSLKWYQNTNEPQFVRHQNDNGTIYIYYRENINATTSIWLYMVDRVDRSGYFVHAAPFTLYREVNVETYNVTITNKPTTYPVKMRNVHHPSDAAFPNTEFSLYTEESYTGSHPTPLKDSLVANEEGYLMEGHSSTIHLGAGTYYLVRTSDADGYLPAEPVRFTITRKGALKVQEVDRAVSGFEYVSTFETADHTYPLLKIPNYKPANLEVLFEAEGDYADLTREFDFTIDLSPDINELTGYVNGVATTFEQGATNEFRLAHGQTLVLQDIPIGGSCTLTQTSSAVAASYESADGQYVTRASVTSSEGTHSTVTLSVDQNDARVLSFSDVLGTADDPARVTIVNTLANEDVPATGINDNEALWSAIVIACGCALLALWLISRRVRLGQRT